MIVLGIESSCDETAAAVLDGGWRLRSNVIASQAELHAPFGGVVPEIASREHLQHLFPLVARALRDAGADWRAVERIAVTAGPGLIRGEKPMLFNVSPSLSKPIDSWIS